MKTVMILKATLLKGGERAAVQAAMDWYDEHCAVPGADFMIVDGDRMLNAEIRVSVAVERRSELDKLQATYRRLRMEPSRYANVFDDMTPGVSMRSQQDKIDALLYPTNDEIIASVNKAIVEADAAANEAMEKLGVDFHNVYGDMDTSPEVPMVVGEFDYQYAIDHADDLPATCGECGKPMTETWLDDKLVLTCECGNRQVMALEPNG